MAYLVLGGIYLISCRRIIGLITNTHPESWWQKLIVVSVFLLFWPLVMLFHFLTLRAHKDRLSYNKKRVSELQVRYAPAQADLLEALTIAEIEAREKVHDPMNAVPDLPFGHLHPAWMKFRQGLAPDDVLWSFRSHKILPCSEKFWSGYVAIREGDSNNRRNCFIASYSANSGHVKTREWYEKAGVQGDANAQFNLGVMYEKGQGGRQDYTKAREWYEKAAAQGNADAQYNLGCMHLAGQGACSDAAKARELFKKAAVQGDARAQYFLGTIYKKGWGVSRDEAKAKEWFDHARANGFKRGAKPKHQTDMHHPGPIQ